MLCISNLKPNCSRYPMYAILKLRINIWSIKKVILQGIITRWGIIFVGLHTMEIIAWSKSFCQSFGSKLHLLCIYILLVNHKLYHEYTPGLPPQRKNLFKIKNFLFQMLQWLVYLYSLLENQYKYVFFKQCFWDLHVLQILNYCSA